MKAQSGTSRTTAFVLTILHRVDSDRQVPQCICRLQTYEFGIWHKKTFNCITIKSNKGKGTT